MSTSVKTPATPKADVLLIDNRFALRRKMSSTALADIYWADDLYTPTQGKQDHIVLLVLAAPAISTLPGFAKAWSAVLSRPAPPAASYPNILDWGNEDTNYWFSCANTQGSLLSEYFNEIEKTGLTPDQALNFTESVSHALANVQAGAFGYFEPGSTLRTDQGYVLLNAPLVKVMHLLLLQQTGVRAPLALHSPWLSPSVAVGDLPVTEDDSFSMASLYQMLSSLQEPYGQQSTLTASARGTPAATNPKLKAEAQHILSQALSLQRNQRPENPEALLKALKRKNYRKALLPIAALAALGVVVYASYHLASKFNDLLHEPTPIAQPQANVKPAPSTDLTNQPAIVGKTGTTNPPTEAVSLANEATNKPAEPATSETAAATTTPTASPAETNTSSPSVNTAVVTPAVATETATTTNNTTTTPVVTNPLTSTPEEVASPAQTTTPVTTNAETIPTNLTESSPTQASTATQPEVNNSANTEQQAQLTQLILKATDAFNAGNITTTDGALATLRQVWTIDRQDPNARALLNKIIAQQQQQTEAHINLNKPEDAKASLTQTDDLIREFTLTDRIEEQVRLESILEIREREKNEADELLQQAKTALKRGNLSKEESENNALGYLNKLMFMLPNHTEGHALLEELVQARQAQIKRNLERTKLSKTGSYLDETSRLIRKYNLTGLTRTQASLESSYRQAVEARQAQANTTSSEQPAIEQATIIVPPPADGEHYVTPDDDLQLLNQVVTNEQPPVGMTVQNPEKPRPITRTTRPQMVPTQPSVSEPVEIEGGPAQLEIPEQNKQAVVAEPIQQPVAQPEELPAEIVLQGPQAIPVEAGTINTQGVLNVQGLAAPPTEEEIPDSERR